MHSPCIEMVNDPSTFQGPRVILNYFSRQIQFPRTFQKSTTFQASMNPVISKTTFDQFIKQINQFEVNKLVPFFMV